MSNYIIEYRGEFSTVVEAESTQEAIAKVAEKPYGYQWECVGNLHVSFFTIGNDEGDDDGL